MTSIRFMIVLNTVQFNLGFTIDEMNIEHDEMEEYADDAQFVIIKQASWDETPEKIVSEYLPIIKKIESALNLDKEA